LDICNFKLIKDSPSLHTDLDYYQALKELLELTLFSYLPCEKVLK